MKKKLLLLVPAITLFLAQPMTVFAVTEAEMEALGKDAVAGNIFIWFLCAIAFLKISQKIDSFMSSLGINVGHTGGSMMAEMMIAARGITSVKSVTGGSFFRGGSYRGGGSSNHASFMAGGFAGAVGRRFGQSAMNTMTGQGSNPISRMAFESSLKKGGEFANNVTGAVAQGNINYTGSMTGPQASQALISYLGQTGLPDAPRYTDVEIGGGRIMGTETYLKISPVEDEEAMRVQSILHLSEAETMAVTHFERGNGLISTNNNNVTVEFKASELEKELITTDRMELKKLLEKEKERQQMSKAV